MELGVFKQTDPEETVTAEMRMYTNVRLMGRFSINKPKQHESIMHTHIKMDDDGLSVA